MSNEYPAAPVSDVDSVPGNSGPEWITPEPEQSATVPDDLSEPREAPWSPNLGQNKKLDSPPQPAALTKGQVERLENFYTSAGLMVTAFNGRAGLTLVKNGEKCANAWAQLAKDNAKVRKAIHAFLEGSAWSEVFMAHMPIALAFLPTKMREQLGIPEDWDEDEDTESTTQ